VGYYRTLCGVFDVVMAKQATQFGRTSDIIGQNGLLWVVISHGYAIADSLVWTLLIVMLFNVLEHMTQTIFAEDDQVVERLTRFSYKAFGKGIGVGRLNRRALDLNALRFSGAPLYDKKTALHKSQVRSNVLRSRNAISSAGCLARVRL